MSSRKKKRGHRALTPPEGGRPHGEHQHHGAPRRRFSTVTALLVTPYDFPGELGDSFHHACAALSLNPASNGYGLVLAQDGAGARWTQITTDAHGVASVRSIWQMGLACDYQPPDGSVVSVRPGWPAGCSLGLAGRREPHDPAGITETCAGSGTGARWTPARRRRMADIIAAELAGMRGRTLGEYIEAERLDAYNMGDNDPSPPPPRLIDMRARIEPDDPARPAVDGALAAAWSLAAAGRPPSGSARTRTLRPGKVRLVRANGDGWSLIGRTDGPVLLVADEIPGVPVDIGGAPRLAALLDALTAAAGRCAG